jgi:broad specificity polyphosphatase/5'/3'-nucleotidase SurE
MKKGMISVTPLTMDMTSPLNTKSLKKILAGALKP